MASVHSGHRARMRARARKEGLKSFQPHEVLELLLMQIIPLRDVNPLAHQLIDRFGTLENVLTAGQEALQSVPGMGERSAQWLLAMGEMALAYSECWHSTRDIVTTSAQATEFIARMPAAKEGDFALACLDHTGRIVHFTHFSAEQGMTKIAREMVRTALLHHAAQAFSVRYCNGIQQREQDREFAVRTTELFKMVEIILLDHIVYGNSCAYSARRDGVIRHVQIEENRAAEKEYAVQKGD